MHFTGITPDKKASRMKQAPVLWFYDGAKRNKYEAKRNLWVLNSFAKQQNCSEVHEVKHHKFHPRFYELYML